MPIMVTTPKLKRTMRESLACDTGRGRGFSRHHVEAITNALDSLSHLCFSSSHDSPDLIPSKRKYKKTN